MPGSLNNNVGSKYSNDILLMQIINRASNVALNRFSWINLPESCDERALELTLMFYGCACFFKDDTLGFIHTPVNLTGPYNIYFESVNRECYSYGNYHSKRTIDDSVLIRNNITQTPDWPIICIYANKIVNALRSIDVHTETIKRPYVLKGDEKVTTSLKNTLKKIADNEIAIVGQKALDNVGVEVLNLNTPCYLAEMWANLKNYMSQLWSSLGIKNSYSEKKERMITSEASGESTVIRHTIESGLSERRRACKLINNMYNLNINVESNQVDVFSFENFIAQNSGGNSNVYNIDTESE